MYVLLAFLPVFLLYVLRSSHIGADTIGYVRNLQATSGSIIQVWKTAGKDPGFYVYTRLISYVTRNYTLYFLITGIIIFYPIYRFSLKYTQNPYVFLFLLITLGYYSFVETGMRQAMAMSICLTAFGTIQKKNVWNILRTFLTVGVAFLFHKSAAVFLLLFIFSFLKDNIKAYIIYFVAAIVAAVELSYFQDIFNEWFGYSYDIESTGNGFIMMVILVGFYIINRLWGNKNADEKTERLETNAANLMLIMWMLRLISRSAERIGYYFILGYFAYITGSFAPDKNSKELSVSRMVILAVCLGLFIKRIMDVSYHFFWSK